MIYKYCRRCGRRLEGEENRLRGYGETCFLKAQREAQGVHPLISPPNKQVQEQVKRLEIQAQRARAEAEQAERARARLQEMQEQSKKKTKSTPKGRAQSKKIF
jgi:hypothetical protein